ncbi:wings apart-like protein homolog isoform X1 [Ranitomeya variabilis]|uniref:wings apart-like protein homolog isoform X1 n=1 Tax=Ranitomeya variabilis TaxID=490064 RepID=UPI0040579CC3
MTSRFGKTYSRKGGNGSSKFDEVFSNKRTTLSTKWGETTFVAKVGQKRQNHKPDIADLPKRTKVDDDEDVAEDPFGFDSDEESKPVSSKSISQPKSAPQQPSEHFGATGSENIIPVLDANSRMDHPIASESAVSYKCVSFDNTLYGLKEKNANKITEDNKYLSSPKKTVTGNAPSFIEDINSFSTQSEYDSKKTFDLLHFGVSSKSCNSSKKPVESMLSSFTTDTDDWDLASVKKSDFPVHKDLTGETQKFELFDWEDLTEEISETPEIELCLGAGSPRDEDYYIQSNEQLANPEEQMSEDVLQGGVKLGNCRTYCRSNKARSSQGSSNFDKLLDCSSYNTGKSNSASDKTNAVNKSSGTRPIGRTRDYTVLHPSCLSVCNVTIQDSMERSMDEFTSSPSTDLGEAGRLRKKADLATAKTTTRFRPGNTKSKKDAKLEFFGFDEQDDGTGGDGGSKPFGQSSYRIKYFGFDDLSESDDEDEDEWPQRERKSKKKAKGVMMPSESIAPSFGVITNMQSIQSTNDIEKPLITQSSRSCSLPDKAQDFLDDPYAVPDVFKKPASRQGDKNKDAARKIFSGPKRSPTKAVYNARHWNHPEAEELPSVPASKVQSAPAKPSETSAPKDDGVFKAPAPPPKVIKTVTVPTQPYQDIVTALKCRKEHKELYTVVQHVKHFNDVVEFGENQEFTDDIEYLLSGLKSNQPINTRCLSVISLATKCAMPSFRMHLRAHGMVAMVFKTLDDSQHHPNLALCTAALMYILSRDRLNMDLDRASLDLMIRLLEMEQDTTSRHMNEKDMNKIKEKIRKLCETVHNKHLDLENITTGHLAMETLLSLTSKRAGDWFKEELRLLGGLDHIVDKVKECVNHLDSDEDQEILVAVLWGAERCLRVLESVTVHNPENQSYLIAYKDSQLIVSSAKALRHCEEFIQRYNRAEDSICIPYNKSLVHHSAGGHVGKAVEDCMRAIIGVLLNLTHDNEWGSTKTGEQDNLISTAMNCVLQVPKYLPQEQRFDIRVLGLGLLINLVEYSARNRHCLVNMETIQSYDSGEGEELTIETRYIDAVHALVQLFLEREKAALLAESQTDELIKEVPTAQHDKSGEWQETGGEIQWVSAEKSPNTEEPPKKEEEEEELDLNKALQHAGKHMEDCIVASYTALLLGCLCQESPINVTTVRSHLPDGDFSIMTEMLKKFLSFMNLTCAVGTTGQKSISRVIEYLEHC